MADLATTYTMRNYRLTRTPVSSGGTTSDGVTLTVKSEAGDVIDVLIPRALALMIQVNLDEALRGK